MSNDTITCFLILVPMIACLGIQVWSVVKLIHARKVVKRVLSADTVLRQRMQSVLHTSLIAREKEQSAIREIMLELDKQAPKECRFIEHEMEKMNGNSRLRFAEWLVAEEPSGV